MNNNKQTLQVESCCHTFVAVVGRVEVGGELSRTATGGAGNGVLQAAVRYSELTGATSGTGAIQVAEHVDVTADVAVVRVHAAADGHSPVPGVGHDHHLAVRAHRLECLRLADLTRVCTYNHHTHSQTCTLYVPTPYY